MNEERRVRRNAIMLRCLMIAIWPLLFASVFFATLALYNMELMQ